MDCLMWGAAVGQHARLVAWYEGLLLALAAALGWRLAQRVRSFRLQPPPKLTPERLQQKLRDKEALSIFDLRDRLEILAEPYMLPGAVQLSPRKLEQQLPALPRDSNIVFYCTCPTDKSMLRMAVKLRRHGFTRLWVLPGGVHAWRERGFAVKPAELVSNSTEPSA